MEYNASDFFKNQRDKILKSYGTSTEDLRKAKEANELSQSPKFKKVMDEWKAGILMTASGDKVTDQKQALAIAFSEAKNVEKSDDFDIEKGGEGSRGGKVIGHTKSGKPIYEKHEQEHTQHYTAEDHSDAMTHHMRESKNYNEKLKNHPSSSRRDDDDREKILEKRQHHSSMAQLHSQAMNAKMDKKADETKKSDDFDIEKGGKGSGRHKIGSKVFYRNSHPDRGEEVRHGKITNADEEHVEVLDSEDGKHRTIKHKNIMKSESDDLEKSLMLEETSIIQEPSAVEETSISKIEKLSTEIKNLLVEQINNELKASQQYRQLSSWLDKNDYEGGQRLFMKWANEEIEHMNSIYEYLFEQNCTFDVPAQDFIIEKGFVNIRNIFEFTLGLEMANTEQWRNIARTAKDALDFQTYDFAEGFLKEQIEEEDKARKILFKINLGIPGWELDELLGEL